MDDRLNTRARGRDYDVFDSQDGGGLNLDLRRVWHIIVKRRLTIGAIIALTLILGLAYTLLATPIYRATAVIQVDREEARVVNVEGVLPADSAGTPQEFYQTQVGLLTSRALAQRVVTELGLARDDRFIASNRLSNRAAGAANGRPSRAGADSAVQRNREAVDQLLKNLQVRPPVNSRLINISYESPDPRLAQRVVNAVAENFIASNLERRFEASSYARRFLEERIQQLRVRLEEAESELVAYASQERIISIPGAANEGRGRSLVSSSLEALNASYAAARAERVTAEQRWRAASAASGLALSEILASPTIQNLRSRRADLSAQYQEQLTRFQPEYPSVQQLAAQIAELDRQIDAEARDVRNALRARYQAALNEERTLQSEITSLENAALDLDRRSIRYNILQRELDTNRTLYDGLLQRYREIGIAGGVGTNNVSVVDRADAPQVPVHPVPAIIVVLALVLGAVLATIAVFVLEYLDESLKTPEEVETKLGLPLLGSIPLLPSGVEPAVAIRDPRSAFSEAYNSVRSALQFARRTGLPRTMLITSSQPAEGKTTSSISLARTFARTGRAVLLIDGDIRDPSLHKAFSAPNRMGLTSILEGRDTLERSVQKTDQENLTLLPSGPRPVSPADVLAGPELSRVLADAASQYDLVIVDGPPVMGLADSPLISRATEVVVFVAGAGGIRRAGAQTAIARLNAAGADIIGGILEKFDAKRSSYGGYGYDYAYSYDYGNEPEPAKSRKSKSVA